MAKFIKITHKGNEQFVNVDYIAIIKPNAKTDLVEPNEYKSIICINDGIGGFTELNSNQTVEFLILQTIYK